ncbi:hypothetical protein C8R44DRAFT_731271 [Mycena epipterygia]|nr:hypothetical protein C8R44DRAFT_731271 [Mycena epipterygia]
MYTESARCVHGVGGLCLRSIAGVGNTYGQPRSHEASVKMPGKSARTAQAGRAPILGCVCQAPGAINLRRTESEPRRVACKRRETCGNRGMRGRGWLPLFALFRRDPYWPLLTQIVWYGFLTEEKVHKARKLLVHKPESRSPPLRLPMPRWILVLSILV